MAKEVRKKRKEKKKLWRKYFTISAAIVVVGFVIISFAIMVFLAMQWWTDKVDNLLGNAQKIASVYSDEGIYKEHKEDAEDILMRTLTVMSESTDSEYFISDLKGNVIFCGDCGNQGAEKCSQHGKMKVNESHIERAIDGGFSDYMTDDDFGFGQFVVAVPVENNGNVYAIAFAVEDAVTGLLPYVGRIAQFMTYTILFVLVFMFIVIYYITRGITRPLEEMKEVTSHIAKGEFDYRASENYSKDFKDFAKSLNKMAYELSIDDESKRSFVANVSHELKTPMTTIGGFIDGILDGTIPQEEEKKYLDIVSKEVKRLARMVVSMLNLSKIEAGEIKISPSEYDIGKQIFDTLLSFEKKIDEKHIQIEGFENIENVTIRADRDLIQQVIYNLFDNAVKFTPEEGAIWIFAKNDGEKTSVRIRNSGAGVSPEEISRIFERFYKVDKSRSYDTKGVGLGLYIVKTIINMHDGEISAASKQGEYTEFSFEIPFN